MDSMLVIAIVVVVLLAAGVALVLRSMDRFQGWRQREKQPPEDAHLDEETISDVLEDPLDRED